MGIDVNRHGAEIQRKEVYRHIKRQLEFRWVKITVCGGM